jgi:hypothetical protein
MKKQIVPLFLFITICILTSCSRQINFNEYVDKNKPFVVTIHKNDSLTGLTTTKQLEILANSDKYNKLTEWADNNTSEWRSTPASYILEVAVYQENFRLLYTTGEAGVVISFMDKENKSRQYRRNTKKGELDFLVN